MAALYFKSYIEQALIKAFSRALSAARSKKLAASRQIVRWPTQR